MTAATDVAQRATAGRIFLALLRRDINVARRELPYFLLRTTLQPLLFIVVFGLLLPRMGYMSEAYKAALLPGVLAVSLAFSMVADFGWTREIEDRLLAPISIELIALEKIVSGVVQGLIAAIFVLPIARLIMGPIVGLTATHFALVIFIVLLGATAFSVLGLLMGSLVNPQQIGLMFSVIVAPMIFFGCAYYPWQNLSVFPAMKYAVLVNPLVYVAEGMRGVLTPGMPHMDLRAVSAALIAIIAIFWTLGMRSFSKRAMG
jgi:ABC-2 type transport system permease protein